MNTSTAKKPKVPTGKPTGKEQKTSTTSKASVPAETAKAPLSALDGSQPAPIAKPAGDPTVVTAAQAVILGPVMRKKELIDTVVAHSGMKKKDVKPVVDSMLEVLGKALADKRELNLQPLGRVKIRREKELPNGRMLIAKIRQNDQQGGQNADVADDAKDI